MAVEGDSHLHKITYPIRPATGDGAHEGFVRDDARGTLFLGEGSWGALPRSADDLKPWTMQAGSFAQFKWVHVYPDHVEIRTVITEEAAGPAANSEENLFAVPADVQLFAPDDQGDVVRYPLAAE